MSAVRGLVVGAKPDQIRLQTLGLESPATNGQSTPRKHSVAESSGILGSDVLRKIAKSDETFPT